MRILVCCMLAGCGLTAEDETTLPVPRAPTIFDRLHDEAGPVPGLDGFSFAHAADDTRCGGVAVSIVRARGAVVSPVDRAFVAVLDAQFPTDLDFSQPPQREAAMKRFDGWLRETKDRSQEALASYEQQLRAARDDGAAAAALARMVQIPRQFASLLARAQMPVDVRTGEHADDKRAAFCDALATAAVPILDKADEAASTCATRSVKAAPGWWSSVCVH